MQGQWNAAAPAAAPAAAMPAAAAPPSLSAIEAVRFVWSAPEWTTSVLIGMVMMLIPLVGPLVIAGYLCEVHQRLVRRHPQPLPKLDFSDFGHYLSRGIAPFIVSLVVVLPAMMLAYAVVGGAVVAGFVVARTSGEPMLGVLAGLGCASFAVVIWVLLSVVMNAAQTRAELTEDFGSSLSFADLLAYCRATFKTVIVKTITFGLVKIGVVTFGLLLCYIGVYPAVVIVQIAGAHLRWQIYENHLAKGGAPVAVKAPVWLPSEARLAPQYGVYGGY